MSQFITYLLVVFLLLYFLYIIFELIIDKSPKIFLVQLIILISVIFIFNTTTGFPHFRKPFAGASPLLAMAIMFGCIILGMISNYLYYKSDKFSFRSFVKPFLVSPFVLLPLFGTVMESSEIKTIQLICLGFVAYQNGFFWRKVVKNEKQNL